jgi:ABC-type glycerol-3-phosphate transport system permease component
MLAILARTHVTTQIRAFMQSEEYLVGLASAYASRCSPRHSVSLVSPPGPGAARLRHDWWKGRSEATSKLGVIVGCWFFLHRSARMLDRFAILRAGCIVRYEEPGIRAYLVESDTGQLSLVFNTDSVWPAVWNTLILAAMSATVGTLLAALIAYISQRRLVRGSHYLGFLATAGWRFRGSCSRSGSSQPTPISPWSFTERSGFYFWLTSRSFCPLHFKQATPR